MAVSVEYAALLAQKKNWKKGATADQKASLDYFIPDTGCKGLFGKVSDEQYDAIIKKMVAESNSYKKALDKIGLDEDELKEIPPVTLYGYEDSKLNKVTVDGYYRSNLYSITHIFFSATQVYMYQLILDTTKNNKKERTEEYFYKDITNFSTSNDTRESLRFTGCLNKLSRVSTEVQQFSLIVPGDKFSAATFGDIEQSVKAMKGKLREKKM